MVRRQHAQRNIFEMILPDGEKLLDPTLRRIHEVLEDEALIDQVEDALRRRRPKSAVRGRPGTPAAVVLRMLVLKHLYDWSFEECEREVRGQSGLPRFLPPRLRSGARRYHADPRGPSLGSGGSEGDAGVLGRSGSAAQGGARAEAAGRHHGGGDEHSSSYRQHSARVGLVRNPGRVAVLPLDAVPDVVRRSPQGSTIIAGGSCCHRRGWSCRSTASTPLDSLPALSRVSAAR